MGVLVIIVLLIVWWRLSNRRTRAIYLAGLTPEERAAHLAGERADELAKRGRPISRQELKTAAVVLGVLVALIFLISLFGGKVASRPNPQPKPPRATAAAASAKAARVTQK